MVEAVRPRKAENGNALVRGAEIPGTSTVFSTPSPSASSASRWPWSAQAVARTARHEVRVAAPTGGARHTAPGKSVHPSAGIRVGLVPAPSEVRPVLGAGVREPRVRRQLVALARGGVV